MLEGDISQTLKTSAKPMVLALLAIGSVGVVDLYFVGRLGLKPLSALGYALPFFFLSASLWVGFGAGVTSVIARAKGAGDGALAQRFAADALLLAIPVGVLLLTGALLLKQATFHTLHVPEELVPSVSEFYDIIVLGTPALAFVAIASAVLRGHGELRLSGALIVLASLINIVLDPLLIIGLGPLPARGVAGAAIAAVCGYGAAAVLSVVSMRKRKLVSANYAGELSWTERMRQLLAVCLPGLLRQIVKPAALLILTAIVSNFGAVAVAVFVTGTNLERLVSNIYLGLASALAPFVGQNWGAGKFDRAALGVRKAIQWVLLAGLGVWLLAGLWSFTQLTGFADNASARTALRWFLWTVPLGYGAGGAILMCISALTAIGRGTTGLWLGVLEHMVVGCTFAAVGAATYGLPGFCTGIMLGEFVSCIEAWRRTRAVKLLLPSNILLAHEAAATTG